jgi:hypothetical protein
VIPPQFDRVGPFSEGLAPVARRFADTARYGYIDSLGKTVVDYRFTSASPYTESLAAVNIGGHEGWEGETWGGMWGFIDHSGRFSIPARFASAHPFHEGLAAVEMDTGKAGKYGYIDRTGAVSIPPRFDRADDFCHGLAQVWVGQEWGYIDHRGRWVWRPVGVAEVDATSPSRDGASKDRARGEDAAST